MRSTQQFAGVDRSLQRAWIKGAGFTDEELAQPLVLIANTYQDFSPENAHLRQVVDAVKAGVRMGGGTPLEFNTFHVTDSEAFAARSMRYVLPSRDVVADSIELMAEGHGVDGLVLLTGGDKPTPGMVMAAARLDLPSILLYAGPTVHGMHRGRKLFLETVYDGVGEVVRGELDEATLRAWEDNLFPGPGAGATLTSGNTAGIYTEALGLSLPGSGTLAAGTNFQLRAAKYTGMRAVELIRQDVRPSQILTRAAFENALRVSLAVSGSTNLVLHFIAMAQEAGIKIDFDFIDKVGRTTPTLAKLAPSGPWGVTELGDAGGVPAVLRELGDLVDGSTITVSGKTTGEIAAEAENLNPDLLHSRSAPLAPEGAIFILRGSLAPDGAVVKASGVAPSMWKLHRAGPGLRGRGDGDRGRDGRRRSRPVPPSSSATKGRVADRACARCSAPPRRWSAWACRRRSPSSPTAASPAPRTGRRSATSGPRRRTAARSRSSRTATASSSTSRSAGSTSTYPRRCWPPAAPCTWRGRPR